MKLELGEMSTINTIALGGGQNAQFSATPGSYENAKKVICVAYTDEMSVARDSHRDLKIGCESNLVSSNQDILDRVENGSLVVVTSQKDFVIGLVGDSVKNADVWEKSGGHVFRYARQFFPLTDILSKDVYQEKWDATCQVLGCEGKNPKYLFHSRFCGYGACYVPALISALRCNMFPRLK